IMKIFETSFDSRELNERINDMLTGGSGRRTEEMIGREGLARLDIEIPDRVMVPAPSNESTTTVLGIPIIPPAAAPITAVETPVVTTTIAPTPVIEAMVEKPALSFGETINALSNPGDKEKVADALKALKGTVAMDMLRDDSPQTIRLIELVYEKGLSTKDALAKVKGNKPSLKTATKNIATALKALQRFTFMDALTLDLRTTNNKEITREAIIKAKEDGLMRRLSRTNYSAYSVLKFRYLESETISPYEVVAEKLRAADKSKKKMSNEAIRLLEKAGLEELCMFAGDKYA
ncbi:MAG: hypothetical protein Q7S22_03315, partial [Candidatus Micrarchaeota archaeon]|nr:hypothetical protein [Candidatus Micrarchaeota archaeon]